MNHCSSILYLLSIAVSNRISLSSLMRNISSRTVCPIARACIFGESLGTRGLTSTSKKQEKDKEQQHFFLVSRLGTNCEEEDGQEGNELCTKGRDSRRMQGCFARYLTNIFFLPPP